MKPEKKPHIPNKISWQLRVIKIFTKNIFIVNLILIILVLGAILALSTDVQYHVDELINEAYQVHAEPLQKSTNRTRYNTPCDISRYQCRVSPEGGPAAFIETLVTIEGTCHCSLPFSHLHYEHLPKFKYITGSVFVYAISGIVMYGIIEYVSINAFGDQPKVAQDVSAQIGWATFLLESVIDIIVENYTLLEFYIGGKYGSNRHIPCLKWPTDRCALCNTLVYDTQRHLLTPLKPIPDEFALRPFNILKPLFQVGPTINELYFLVFIDFLFGPHSPLILDPTNSPFEAILFCLTFL
jgi:hypothetical protein